MGKVEGGGHILMSLRQTQLGSQLSDMERMCYIGK